MQKPIYIKINLPITKSNDTKVIKRYFQKLKNTFIEVEFFNIRKGKSYTYKIDNVEEFKKYFGEKTRKKTEVKLTLIKNKI